MDLGDSSSRARGGFYKGDFLPLLHCFQTVDKPNDVSEGWFKWTRAVFRLDAGLMIAMQSAPLENGMNEGRGMQDF